MISTNNLINRISNYCAGIILISLLLLIYINCINNNCKGINILISMSNTYLFSIILMVILNIKILIFNITSDIVQNNIDVNDTLFCTMNMIFSMLVVGIYFQYIHTLIILSSMHKIIFIISLLFFACVNINKIRQLLHISDNNKLKKNIKEKLD